jgi:CheY-like chemotaxis protein
VAAKGHPGFIREILFNMKRNATAIPFGLAFTAREYARVAQRFLRPVGPHASLFRIANRFQPSELLSTKARTAAPVLIYAVDDMPGLTELYRLVLTAEGFAVRVFNHRVQALRALQDDGKPPGLLITDYVGTSLPIDRFLQSCRAIHPRLRILMASGLNQTELIIPGLFDRYLQKPFTPDELRHAVKAALAKLPAVD